nr:putative reverse transcriptase domain-containing protein [Tanacetum cinerariifolium]
MRILSGVAALLVLVSFHQLQSLLLGLMHFPDLEASISLIPYTMYEKLGLGEPKSTRMILELADSANEVDEKKPELKELPPHLEYAYLKGDESCPIIISSRITEKEKALLLQVLKNHRGAIAWKMSDIKGISSSFCPHKILMEESFKPVIQPQRRLNLKVQDVVKDEILKLLDSGLIYPISDSPWVSPIHVVPKKEE